jgi:hypothetical protein
MDYLTERLMADFACLDPVYVDDAVGAMNLGANCQLLLYRWVRMSNNGDPNDYERSAAVNLIVPRTSVLARSGIVASWLSMSTPSKNAAINVARAMAH